MNNFKKLSQDDKLKQIELFISSLPKAEQAKARKAILGA